MASAWHEVCLTRDENRCELVLSGAEISKRIDQDGLDANIFTLKKINFLEISKTCLYLLPDAIGNLSALTNLSLTGNRLTLLPSTIGKLHNLKLLDVSYNELRELPANLGHLTQLHSLNACRNKLKDLPPSVGDMTSLAVVDLSHNLLDRLPLSLCDKRLERLAELRAKGNALCQLPAELSNLVALKNLDVGDNKVTVVPGELGDCARLKEVKLDGNPLSDRRLAKLVTQAHFKQIVDYIRSCCPRGCSEDGAGDAAGGGKKKGNAKKKAANKKKKPGADDDIDKLADEITVLHVNDDVPVVVVTDEIKEVRPFIVCCIMKDVDLEDSARMKRFIAIQTKLHDDKCQKRNAATIATHDLAKIGSKLVYDARRPGAIKLTPLSRSKDYSAAELFKQLQAEAEAVRKEKKRNAYSGIHRYLYLLENKTLFPCLVDDQQQRVISFPPITNSEATKITASTKDLFVEVTSSNSLPICKEVMEELIKESLKMNISPGSKGSTEDDEGSDTITTKKMTVQQVKICAKDGTLRVVYPATPDLQLEGINVVRAN